MRFRTWTCALLLSMLGSVVHAQDEPPPEPSSAPRLVSPRAPFPADGALLILSTDLATPTVIVNDRTSEIAGRLSLLSEHEDAYYAWKPDEPFALGRYDVVVANQAFAFLENRAQIEVTEPFGMEPPVITTSPEVSAVIAPYEHACCTNPLGDPLELCATSGNRTSALLGPGLQSAESISKLNQFLYRTRPAPSSVAHVDRMAWKPFELVDGVELLEEDDEYCFELESLNIVTLDVHMHSELEGCAARGDIELGTTPVALPEALLAHEECLHPPMGHETEWCDANANVCAAESMKCGLYEYVCEDGVLPQPWRDTLEHRNNPAFLPTAHASDGCSAASARSSPRASGYGWLAGLLLLRTRRRARLRRSRRPGTPRRGARRSS